MALLSQGGHSTGLCSLNSIPWIFMSSVVYFFFLLLSFFLFTRSLFLFLWALRTCQVGHFDSHLFWYLNEFFNENLVLTGGRYSSFCKTYVFVESRTPLGIQDTAACRQCVQLSICYWNPRRNPWNPGQMT